MELDESNNPSSECYDSQYIIQKITKNGMNSDKDWNGKTMLQKLLYMKELCSNCENGHCIEPCVNSSDKLGKCKLNKLLEKLLKHHQFQVLELEQSVRVRNLFESFSEKEKNYKPFLKIDYLHENIPLFQNENIREKFDIVLDEQKLLEKANRIYYELEIFQVGNGNSNVLEMSDQGNTITINNYLNTQRNIEFKIPKVDYTTDSRAIKCSSNYSNDYIVVITLDHKKEYSEYVKSLRKKDPSRGVYELWDLATENIKSRKDVFGLGRFPNTMYLKYIVMYSPEFKYFDD